MAGYSNTPLVKKIGLDKVSMAYLYKAPNTYLDLIQQWEGKVVENPTEKQQWIHGFFFSQDELQSNIDYLYNLLNNNGQLWISWPKKTSDLQTDLNGNIVREIGLNHGLVDVKVVAIDEVWSGLKFVYRLKDRKKKTSQ